MSDSKFKIDLEKRIDSYGQTYYLGKLKAPVSIDCHDGVAFLVFISESGLEQIQVSSFENKEKTKVYTIEKDRK